MSGPTEPTGAPPVATAVATSAQHPELVLLWLFLLATSLTGLVLTAWALATGTLAGVAKAALLLTGWNLMLAMMSFFLLLGATVALRAVQAGPRGAWGALLVWSLGHSAMLYASTHVLPLPMLTALIDWPQALLALAAIWLSIAWLRRPLLGYLAGKRKRVSMSWVDRRYVEMHGKLHDWQRRE